MSDAMVEKLMGEGGGEKAVFLNDIVAQLWPNINVAGSQMTKEIADPMFKTMLPGPLSSLHFTKVDLGKVPMKLSNVRTTRTETNGIKLDLNVDWDGSCDIELDGDMIPQLGVESVKLHGRLSILLCPLTNVIPLIGAAQISFINPPILKLDFTGAANIADFSAIDGSVRQVILTIINGMFTLPNRFLVKLDANNDYFKTYLEPLGIIRITVDKAWGFAEDSKSKTKKLFSKLTRSAPDSYAKVSVGAEEAWKTTTKNNTTHPEWRETHDFVVSDFDQIIKIDIEDEDVGGDDEVGIAAATVRDVLQSGGHSELPMVRKNGETDGRVSLACQFFKLEADGGQSFSAADHRGEGLLCGIATVLVAGAFGIKGAREQLKPSVVVTWGKKHHFQTAIKEDAPGTDISNPAFDQNFRIPVTPEIAGSGEAFRIALMNGEKEIGGVEVPFGDVVKAPGMTVQNRFDVGGGASVRASICLRGVRAGRMEEASAVAGASLPQRPRQG